MARLSVFNFITLNGFYKGPGGDISWHRHGQEENEYAGKSLNSDNILLFGRVTYEMMASYWPTDMAKQNDPKLAEGMNLAEKIVFTNTLKNPEWNNTKVIGGDIISEVKKLKESGSKDMTILGSGSIVSQFADAGIIDSFQIMLDPVALGEGTSIFNKITQKLDLKLTGSNIFRSGVVLLHYEPI
jgi:dihydrofolate reductase